MSDNNKSSVLAFFWILFFVSAVSGQDDLAAHNPLYGLASLAFRMGNQENITCFREFEHLKRAVDSEKVWALKVLDASGRPSSGFLYGNNLWIGSHSQCTDIQNRKPFEIRHEKVNHTETPFDYPPYGFGFATVMLRHNSTLQYHMRLPLDYTVQLGLCLPKSCTGNQIELLSKWYFGNASLAFQKEYKVDLEVSAVRLLKEDALWLLSLPKTMALIIVMGTILLLVTVGTVYDVRLHKRQKLMSIHEIEASNSVSGSSKILAEILCCFSFYSNVKKWTKTKISADSITIIHGLRFLAMGWVIMVHTSFFQADFIANPPYAYRISEDFVAQIVSNSTYAVDTYFFLSGFLLAFTFFKHLVPGTKPDTRTVAFKKFIFLFINRFFRLTPTYAIVILLTNVVCTYYYGTSSLYFNERPDVVCDKYWWRNILYINNLYPRSEMCLSWSWYLSVDMQCFLVGTFLLLLSTIYFSVAAVFTISLIFVHIITTAYTSYMIGYIPTLDDQLEQLDAIYDFPWNRSGPYMVGLITAYVLVVQMNNQMKLKERTRLLLWTIFPLLNLWILFTLYTRQLSVEFSAFYMGVSRPLWGVGIAWFVVAVSTGNARLLEKLLSYKAWIPLGRLTYCAYLLNPLVVIMVCLGSEASIQASIPEMAMSVNGTVMTTMMMSFLFSLMFETPFIVLTKKLFGLSAPKKRVQTNGHCKQFGTDQNGSNSTISTVA